MSIPQHAKANPAPSRRPARPAPLHDWPDGLPYDSRFVSNWSDSIVRLRDAVGEERTLDLPSVPLPANDSLGGPFSHGLELGQFPHWLQSARAHVVLSLQRFSGRDALDQTVGSLNHALRFFAWCVRRRCYRLADLTPRDLVALREALRPNGWASAFDSKAALLDLVTRCAMDPQLRARIASPHGHVCCVSSGALSRHLGYIVTRRETPVWFREAIASQMGLPPNRVNGVHGLEQGWSESSFKTCFCALNELARLPPTLDRLQFEPFRNARAEARRAGGRPDGRTQNLAIEDAAQLLGTCLTWLYRRSDAVIELVTLWRQTVVEQQDCGSTKSAISRAALRAVRERYSALRDAHDFPYSHLCGLSGTGHGAAGPTLLHLVWDVMTAAFIVVAITQARRKNEVLGERRRPWGLYAACLQRADPYVEAYTLDIYIEKTWKCWMRMPASKLTVDAVGVLERLRLAALPDESPSLSEEAQRSCKLFDAPSYGSLGGAAQAMRSYVFDRHSASLYSQAGLAPSQRKTHPFRRLFALLYTYRWDHPKLQALSEHLAHLELESTRLYVTDPVLRAQAERIEQMYRSRADCFPEGELTQAQQAYADDQLSAMLTHSGAGGPLTRRVHRWVQRLWRHVDLSARDMTALHHELRAHLSKRGYAPTPMRHGVCWAQGVRHAGKGRCSQDGRLHRERADVGLCGQCPFHSTSQAFLGNVEQQAQALEAQAASASSALEAQVSRAAAEHLRQLIALELALIERQCPPDVAGGAP